MVLGAVVIKRRLPHGSGRGQIFTSAKVGGLKYLLKRSEQWDPELLGIASALVAAGDAVWDVGANVGLFSKAAGFHAGTAGSVLSIEADLDAVALLNATSRLQPDAHALMTVLPVAVSDESGIVRFAIAKRARASNAIEGFGSTQTGGVSELRTLPCMTLDSLLPHFPSPDVLKIDVEGAEMRVLKGALQLLESARPRIYCEVCSRTRDDVVALLQGFGYRLWDGASYGDAGAHEVSAVTTNIVALPRADAGNVQV